MTDVILFHSPAACSRVTMNALEEIGVPFEDRPVNIMAGAQREPEYLRLNPRGQVPTLCIGDQVMTENAAIVWFLAQRYPEARLLPRGDNEEQGLIDLIWCTSMLHMLVRLIRMPGKLTTGDPEEVKAAGIKLMSEKCELLTSRLGAAPWWYGEAWSIVDVYIYWCYSTAAGAGFPLEQFPALGAHAERVRARPSFQRALRREQAAVESTKIEFPPGVSL